MVEVTNDACSIHRHCSENESTRMWKVECQHVCFFIRFLAAGPHTLKAVVSFEQSI